MSGNYGGYGNQPGWGPPPQRGYPGYPPSPEQGERRLWYVLVGICCLLLLTVTLCVAGVAWLLVRRGRTDVAMQNTSESETPVAIDVAPSRPRPIPSREPGNRPSAIIPAESATVETNSPQSGLPPDVRPLFLSVRSSGSSSSGSSNDDWPLPPKVETNGWRVKVDPLVGESAQVVPQFKIPSGCQFKQVNWPWPQMVLYGRVPGGGLQGSVYQIWDLTTGKGIAAFPKTRFTTDDDAPLAISPRGARAAIITDSFPGKEVVVASMQSGDVEKTLALALDKPELVRFLTNDRILAAETRGTSTDPAGVQILSIAEEKSVSLGGANKVYLSSIHAVSPGGKYVAMRKLGQSAVLVFDAETGALAGEVKLTFNAATEGILGLGFSPDGKRLACVVGGNEQTCYLAGVDVASGERAFSHLLSCGFEPKLPGDYPALQWLPDGRRCLLFGQEVFDCQSGVKLATPAADKLASLHPDQTVTVTGAWLFGNRLLLKTYSDTIHSVDLDVEQLAKEAAEVSVPTQSPLTPIDLTAVERVAEEPAASWNVPISSPPEIGSPVYLKLPVKEGEGFFAGPSDGPLAGKFNAVCYGKAPFTTVLLTSFLPDYLEGERPVHRYDLRTAASFAPFSLPRACEPAALSDARQVLTVNRQTKSRVDLWSAVDGEHVRGWEPFEGQTGDAGTIAWADFTVDGRVLTLSKSGELICWADDAPRAVYRRRFDTQVAPKTNSAKTWLLGYDGRGFTFLDTVTGRNLGFLELRGNDVSAMALRGDDRMLAAVVKMEGGPDLLCICDLKEGSVVSRFAPNHPIVDPVWFGDKQLLTKSGALIDIFTGVHAWDFTLPRGGRLAAFGGCVWLLEEETVTGCKLADLASGPDLILALAPGAQQLVRPGDEIGLAVPDDFATQARLCITRAGFEFNENADRKLRISVRSEKTGKKVSFGTRRPFGFRPRPGDVELDEVDLVTHVELRGPSGGSVWSTEYRTAMPRTFFGLRSRGDPASAIANSQRKRCVADLLRVSLPRQVVSFGGATVGLPGYSSLEEELHGKAEPP